MVVVEDVVSVGAELRREVLGLHGAVGRVAVAVEPGPVAGEWIAFSGDLRGDARLGLCGRGLIDVRCDENGSAGRLRGKSCDRACDEILFGSFQRGGIASVSEVESALLAQLALKLVDTLLKRFELLLDCEF